MAWLQQFNDFAVMEQDDSVFALSPFIVNENGSRMTAVSVVWVADWFDPETQVSRLEALFFAFKTSAMNGGYARLDVPINLEYAWRGLRASVARGIGL